MDTQVFLPARAKISTDGGASVTAFAPISGTRWVLQAANIGWNSLLTSATVALFETTTTGSMADGTIFLQFAASATSGYYSIYFGEIGVEASATNDMMGIMTGAVAGTFTAVLTGYYKGG